MMDKRLILACAFSCCPPTGRSFSGGEDLLGWNLLKQIGRFHEIWAITSIDNRSSIEEFLEKEPIPNLHFCYVSLPSWLRPLLKYQGGHQLYYYIWQWKSFFVAKKLHKRISFDLFHHITYANDWMASFIGALLPIPYLRGPGGGAHKTPKGLTSEYAWYSRVWERIRTPAQWLFRHDPFFIIGQNRATTLLVCNDESLANIPHRWSHKTRLFPVNGVSSEDLGRSESQPRESNDFRIVSAGSLIKVKGFGLALKAFSRFVQDYPKSTFYIVGSGPEERRLRLFVRDANLVDKVKFLPGMGRDELLSWIRSSDLFLFPSLRDGGGAVVVEAMAAGKPVICLDNGGPRMHVTDDCGVKIIADSAEDAVSQISDNLKKLYIDKALRTKLGAAARERAENYYHWDRLGDQMINIYEGAFNIRVQDSC